MRCDIPFRLVGGAQPLAVLPVSLNGSGPFEFALDTGAASPVFSPELTRRLSLPIDETRDAAGAGGRVRVGLARVDRFVVGEASRRDVPVIVTGEIDRIGAAIGSPLDGVIGYEFLRHFRLTVDYSRLMLRLEDGSSAHLEDSTQHLAELPLRLAHPAKPLILVPTMINGTGPHPFALDTGASVSVIAGDLAARLGVRMEPVPSMTGGGGAIPSYTGLVRSLAVEAAEVTHLPVAVADFLDGLSQAIGTELLGIIGYNYLREFRLTIDYPGAVLHLD
jgi:predicted aspartyl protease